MLPFSRHGRWEILIGTVLLGGIAWLMARFIHPATAIVPLAVWVWLLAFFRDPQRPIPSDTGLMVSPADGTVSTSSN